VSEAAAGPHGHSKPDACSVLWDNAQALALGTAPLATFWVALEQNGPWGAKAATQSHLDPDLGRTLDQMCQDAGGRFMLIRRPGRHPDRPDITAQKADPDNGDQQKASTRKVYLAGGLADRPWLLEADLDAPERLARLGRSHMDALSSGDIDVVLKSFSELERSQAPVLMICSNSKRDLCCSVRGRPVAVEAASQRPGQVWECSHTGGHRFAPTGVLLPQGQTFGRLSATSAVDALDAGMRDEVPMGLLGATHDRGRSHLSAPGQAAESILRAQIQETSLLSTKAVPQPGQEYAWQCRVSHVDGRHWDAVAVRVPCGDELPESCGKDPVPRWDWKVIKDSGYETSGR
jgi:hypothetical protein